MNWLAIDVGGANLKAANGQGYGATLPFALWKRPEDLTDQLRRLISESPTSERLAVTMTGELADCYPSREVGVVSILDAVEHAAAGRHTRVYWRDGRLVSLEVARRRPLMAAAANWHALARFAAQWIAPDQGILLDIGSTTTDILPLGGGKLLSDARTDLQRLLRQQLVYTGIERSPICGVTRHVEYRGQPCQVAQELFATTLDVHLLRGDISESMTNTATADGRPATKAFSRARLARSICAESEEFHHRDAVRLAKSVVDAQLDMLEQAVRLVHASMPLQAGADEDSPENRADPEGTWRSVPTQTSSDERELPRLVLSGAGEFLGRDLAKRMGVRWTVSMKEHIGANAARAAAAHALAVLADQTGA